MFFTYLCVECEEWQLNDRNLYHMLQMYSEAKVTKILNSKILFLTTKLTAIHFIMLKMAILPRVLTKKIRAPKWRTSQLR